LPTCCFDHCIIYAREVHQHSHLQQAELCPPPTPWGLWFAVVLALYLVLSSVFARVFSLDVRLAFCRSCSVRRACGWASLSPWPQCEGLPAFPPFLLLPCVCGARNLVQCFPTFLAVSVDCRSRSLCCRCLAQSFPVKLLPCHHPPEGLCAGGGS
jgi:hypothetical protein